MPLSLPSITAGGLSSLVPALPCLLVSSLSFWTCEVSICRGSALSDASRRVPYRPPGSSLIGPAPCVATRRQECAAGCQGARATWLRDPLRIPLHPRLPSPVILSLLHQILPELTRPPHRKNERRNNRPFIPRP
ncbi:hypothetical protein LX36DRAFT_250555 [Colletotrichum falcatum]|nr:hypothetical protein LX36DRAFT_250555 [Colletotrichum falcatum]